MQFRDYTGDRRSERGYDVGSVLGSLVLGSEWLNRVHFALHPQKRDGLLGMGKWDARVKALPRILPKKDRRDHGPPPEQWKC